MTVISLGPAAFNTRARYLQEIKLVEKQCWKNLSVKLKNAEASVLASYKLPQGCHSQLVNKMCLQQTCKRLVEALSRVHHVFVLPTVISKQCST